MDIVISIGALKTHGQAGTTGCVKNLGIGATPSTQYSVSTSAADCTRNNSGVIGTQLSFQSRSLSWVKVYIDSSTGSNPAIGEIVLQ